LGTVSGVTDNGVDPPNLRPLMAIASNGCEHGPYARLPAMCLSL